MASRDRRCARALYFRARLFLLWTTGFAVASLVYPALNPGDTRSPLPSTVMAVMSAGLTLLCVAAANFRWWRDR